MVSKAHVIVKVLDIRLSDHKITVIDVKLYDEDDTIDKVNHILNLKISILISNLYYILLLERSQNSESNRSLTHFILPSLLYLTEIGHAVYIYYSYLWQAIHNRVTSEVNIAKIQMAAIFSLDSKVWLINYAVWLHTCR